MKETDALLWVGYGVGGKAFDLGEPLTAKLQKSLDTPADSLTAEFLTDVFLPELREVALFAGKTLLYRGVVDEQSTELDAGGLRLEVVSRSPAALLLDNEAVPVSYVNPTLLDLFHRHAKPYGFAGILRNLIASFPFTVSKGISEWEVLDSFCRMSGGDGLRVTADLYLQPGLPTLGETVLFSNHLTEGSPYQSLCLTHRRYGVVSRVSCKLETTGGYSYHRGNTDAVERGIVRRRLLNLSSTHPALYDHAIRQAFSSSEEDALRLELTLPGLTEVELGQILRLYHPRLTLPNQMRVATIVSRLDGQGWSTTLTATPVKGG